MPTALPNKAELKEEYDLYVATKKGYGYKSAEQYIEAGFERPTWQFGDIIRQVDFKRLNSLPPPPRQTAVVVELDDVVRATSAGIVEGTKLPGVGMADLESRFLFQCKGFGTPTDVVKLLDSMPYTPVKAVDDMLYALHSLAAMEYKVYIATSRSDDKATKEWLETWLIEHGLYVGKGELVREILYLSKASGTDNEDLIKQLKAPAVTLARPADVPLSDEDVSLVEAMRRAEDESNVTSLNHLADIIRAKDDIEEVMYVGPSLIALEALKPLLQERGVVHSDLILFGGYAWNKTKLDWREKGAWMTYQQRVESGQRLGASVTDKIDDVKAVGGWREFLKLLDPEEEVYLWRNEKKGVAGDPAKVVADVEDEPALSGEST